MLFVCALISILLTLGFFLSGKESSPEEHQSSPFECGFTSYFYSRFSFSIQYFMVALIFLFLDLELCLIIPFFANTSNFEGMSSNLFLVAIILLTGLVIEWVTGKLGWLK